MGDAAGVGSAALGAGAGVRRINRWPLKRRTHWPSGDEDDGVVGADRSLTSESTLACELASRRSYEGGSEENELESALLESESLLMEIASESLLTSRASR
jgi:hypothetical protein